MKILWLEETVPYLKKMTIGFNIDNKNINADKNSFSIATSVMGGLIRTYDWSATCLGPSAQWPLSLKIALNMILPSSAPLVILWGKEGIVFYNDAYIPFAGTRHPALLGSKCAESWPEAADFIQNVIHQCLQGETLTYRNLHYKVNRNIIPEDVWMDLDCSPIMDDQGQPAGVLIVNIETTEYMQTVQVLKENEERYRLVIDGTNDGIWDFNLETRTAYWNDRLYEILGYSRHEIAQPGFEFVYSIIHPEDQQYVKASFIKASQEGAFHNVQYRVKHHDGHYVYVHATGKPVYDEHGKIVRLAGITRDITQQKLTEIALKESEERFSGIFNQTSVGIAQVDLNGNFVLVNQQYCEMVGRSKEELYQMRMQDISHQQDVPGNMTLFRQAVMEGVPFVIEKRYTRPDGSQLWVRNNVSPVKDSAGKPIYVVAVCQDITERKRAEEALQESEARFRTMAEASGIMIAQTDESSNAVYFNKEWLKMTGRSMGELINYGWASLLHPEDREGFVEAYKIAFEKKEVLKREFRLLSHTDEYRWFLAIISPRIGPNGNFEGHVSSCVDITELKRAEEALALKNNQLVRINNDLDNFIYTASHDLKSPINNIEGLVNALNRYLDDTTKEHPRVQNFITMLYESIDRFKRTIKELTEVAKVQSNTEEDIAEVSFKALLEEVKLNIKDDIEASKAVITEDFSQVPGIYFSKKNLRSILYNLVSNAIKYSSPDRQVQIHVASAATDNHHVLLTVQDNGLGIKEADKSKVFMMFKRLHQHVEGTGVGLSIVKKIIDNNGGKIEIESEEGKGTLFKVYFKV